MDSVQVIVLALVQGLTEFLPVSSSAHLVLVAPLLGWPDQGLAFDIAVHLGTLGAVVVYFRQHLFGLASGMIRPGVERQEVLNLALATLPAVIAGFALADWLESWARAPEVIMLTTLCFGLLLGFADRKGGGVAQITLSIALVIGLFQVLALVPGTSRSGITMTAALLLGVSRVEAARFSFLLSIPIIAGASLLLVKDAVESSLTLSLADAGLGVAVAFASALLCIRFFSGLGEAHRDDALCLVSNRTGRRHRLVGCPLAQGLRPRAFQHPFKPARVVQ